MIRFRWLLVGIVAVVSVLAMALRPGQVSADDGFVGIVGYGAEPLQSNEVIMAAERVDITIEDGKAEVSCVFTFTNTASDATVVMGFPQMKRWRDLDQTELLDFTANVDGVALPVTFRPQVEPTPQTLDGLNAGGDPPESSRYEGWHTFEVAFAAGQTRVVSNSYHGLISGTSDGQEHFGYVLHTGASWKGPIGVADVVVRWMAKPRSFPGQ